MSPEISIEKASCISLLRKTIRLMHECDARHRETVFIQELFDGRAIWKGDVEVFDLNGHPEAAMCYAWLDDTHSDRSVPVVFLQKWPTVSPQAAVRTALAFNILRPKLQLEPNQSSNTSALSSR